MDASTRHSRHQASAQTGGHTRVGYYLWRFPSLTGSYIHREVGALRHAGLDIEVFADMRAADDLLDADARAFINGTHYLLPIDPARLRSFRRRVRSRDPRAVSNAFAYTALHRYAALKSRREDARIFRHALYLAGYLLERNITHLHSPWANLSAFIALLAARMAGVSYSVQARASADLYRDHSRWALDEKLSQARFVITNSEFNRAFIARTVSAARTVPVHVIYEGLDLARFAPPTHAAPRDPIRILSVGRLAEEKGHEYLLQALVLMRDRGRSFQCVIVGGADKPSAADYERRLRELRRTLQLEDSVRLAGALPFDQVLEEYARADLFALPSIVAADGGRDVTPNALIEAMAMRLPVVATSITGIPEIVEHRGSGILIPPRNAEALAQALLEIADSPQLAEHLGRNARRRVGQRFDIHQNVRRYVDLFTARHGR